MNLEKKFMGEALTEAKRAYSINQLPIGAALAIDGNLVGVNSNTQVENNNWFNHAENILIQEHSELIKESRENLRDVELYTTFEPCLMCLGAAAHNRITKIVFACPDPVAGSSHIQPPTEWYSETIKWPIIKQGFFIKESYELFMKYIRENPKGWEDVFPIYEGLKDKIYKPIISRKHTT